MNTMSVSSTRSRASVQNTWITGQISTGNRRISTGNRRISTVNRRISTGNGRINLEYKRIFIAAVVKCCASFSFLQYGLAVCEPSN